jgi:hypothetical protein
MCVLYALSLSRAYEEGMAEPKGLWRGFRGQITDPEGAKTLAESSLCVVDVCGGCHASASLNEDT